MPIDLDKALTAPPATREIAWTTRDVLLYHLSLGLGPERLDYVFEDDLQVLPTFAMVAGQGVSAGEEGAVPDVLPGIEVDLHRMLHAGQSLTVHRPLPPAGTATLSRRVADVWDKGKAAVIVLETVATDANGVALWTQGIQIWAKGEGGFGGNAGPELTWSAPDREPDAVLDAATRPDQALLYRLNGDLNPLHADPAFARRAGFDQPILHGLASYGMVARSLVEGLLDGDASRLGALDVRFAGVLFPGETIRTEVWRDGDTLTLRASCVERDGAPVLTHASATVVESTSVDTSVENKSR